ncbi:MAG: DUF2336 domain-containing protein [Xanthobacteraceae bacterium]
MPESRSFLRELDDAVSRGSAESRLRALWHATDLLITGRYTEDQIWIFGEVIGRLAEEIEVAARAKLAVRLARTDNAPFSVVYKLAFDDSIDVAGPILRQSERLGTRALVANAETKGQQHLLAISKRKSIDGAVTDVLVTRGNREVVKSVAANDGACFSEFGFLQLLKRSEGDAILTEHVGLRADIPRHVFQQLIAKASDDVKRKLASERREMAVELQDLVTDVTGVLHSKFGPASKSYFAAKRTVSEQHRHGDLNENCIFEYASSRRLEEVTVGLSLLCSLPTDVVERALLDKNKEIIMVLAKARDFSWETTMSLLFLGAPDHRIAAQDLDVMRNEFSVLKVETSQKVLEIYQSRRNAAAADSGPRRLPQLHGY